jgi:hypothetical protein
MPHDNDPMIVDELREAISEKAKAVGFTRSASRRRGFPNRTTL